jgi:hypothetical protein
VAVAAAFAVLATCSVVTVTATGVLDAGAPDVAGMAAVAVPVATVVPTTVATTLATTLPITVATTPPPTTVAPPPPLPAPCAVSFVADSVGTGVLRNGLADDLGGVVCPLVWHAAYGGMAINVGIDLLARASGQRSNVALVMLGFRNARSEVGAGRFPGWIDAVVTAAAGRTVVWPMLAYTNGCSAGYQQALTQADAELVEAQQRWPNLVLVDNPAFLVAHPEFDIGDGPHLNAAGYRAVGEWLASEVRRLVEARAPAAPHG